MFVQTDKEFQETYMTYKYSEIDHGNYTKTFDAGKYAGDIPDTVDWRTSNAVTSITNQVCTILSNTHTYVTSKIVVSSLLTFELVALSCLSIKSQLRMYYSLEHQQISDIYRE